MQISTLLIVESPTIAKIIDAFQLPGLEVVATAGYSWKPKPDYDKGTLKGIAGPELLPVRNLIRSAAAGASRIILATDTDPSGEFIAKCLAGELKNRRLFRSYLNVLSPPGISHSMERALPYEPGTTNALLNRLYLNAKLLPGLPPFISSSARTLTTAKKISPLSVILGKLALYPYFFSQRDFTRFESDGRYYTSDKPVPAVYGREIESVVANTEQPLFHVNRPWSTGKFISNFSKPGYQSGQFSQVQEILNRLFTTVPDEAGTGLITYPRTHSTGFYQATWQQEYDRLIRFNQAESILPVALWSITPDETAHEALRPLNVDITPSDVRRMVRKNLYEAYSLLHNATSAALRPPTISKATVYSDKKGNIFTEVTSPFNTGQILLSIDRSSIDRSSVDRSSVDHVHSCSGSPLLVPVSTLDDLIEFLVLYALLPASAIGLTLDTLISDGWIGISGSTVLPGSRIKEIPSLFSKSDDILHLLRLLREHISLAQHPSELDDLINRMISITNEDINS